MPRCQTAAHLPAARLKLLGGWTESLTEPKKYKAVVEIYPNGSFFFTKSKQKSQSWGNLLQMLFPCGHLLMACEMLTVWMNSKGFLTTSRNMLDLPSTQDAIARGKAGCSFFLIGKGSHNSILRGRKRSPWLLTTEPGMILQVQAPWSFSTSEFTPGFPWWLEDYPQEND